MPFDRTPYTPGMREVLKLSKREAARFHHDFTGPEHFLLGIIRKGDGLAVQVLMNLDVDLDSLRVCMEGMLPAGGDSDPILYPPTEETRAVLDATKVRAREMKHNWIGTEHLLLGLLSVAGTIPQRCLQQLGIGFVRAQEAVIRVIDGTSESQPAPSVSPIASDLIHHYYEALERDRAFTPDLQQVLDIGRSEAFRTKSLSIRPQHYILGFLGHDECLAAQVLKGLRIDPDQLKLAMENAVMGESGPCPHVVYPSAESIRALGIAKEMAFRMRDRWVGTQHLLLALIAEEEISGSGHLRKLGIEFGHAQQQAMEAVAGDVSSFRSLGIENQ